MIEHLSSRMIRLFTFKWVLTIVFINTFRHNPKFYWIIIGSTSERNRLFHQFRYCSCTNCQTFNCPRSSRALSWPDKDRECLSTGEFKKRGRPAHGQVVGESGCRQKLPESMVFHRVKGAMRPVTLPLPKLVVRNPLFLNSSSTSKFAFSGNV